MLQLLLLTTAFVTSLSAAIASDSPKPADMEAPSGTSVEASDIDEDPFEPLNRVVHYFNRGFDAFIMKPLAIAYRLGLPEPVRNGIGNFFVNLHAPVSVLNHLLQGEGARAGNTSVRFLINTTIGCAGFMDMARPMGHEAFETNFNETLGVWGVNRGPYLVLPFLGPSSIRNTVGIVADTFTKPETYYFMNDSHKDKRWLGYTLVAVEQIHYRNTLLEALDDIANNSADTYATLRSIYLQKQDFRQKELKEGRAQNPAEVTEEPTESPQP